MIDDAIEVALREGLIGEASRYPRRRPPGRRSLRRCDTGSLRRDTGTCTTPRYCPQAFSAGPSLMLGPHWGPQKIR